MRFWMRYLDFKVFLTLADGLSKGGIWVAVDLVI